MIPRQNVVDQRKQCNSMNSFVCCKWHYISLNSKKKRSHLALRFAYSQTTKSILLERKHTECLSYIYNARTCLGHIFTDLLFTFLFAIHIFLSLQKFCRLFQKLVHFGWVQFVLLRAFAFITFSFIYEFMTIYGSSFGYTLFSCYNF